MSVYALVKRVVVGVVVAVHRGACSCCLLAAGFVARHVTARVSCGGGTRGGCASLWFALERDSASEMREKARAKFEFVRTSMRA